MDLKLLESELLKLTPKEKAAIAFKLLKEIENEEPDNIEEVWIDEAIKRYEQIKGDEKISVDGDLVLKEAKSKYK